MPNLRFRSRRNSPKETTDMRVDIKHATVPNKFSAPRLNMQQVEVYDNTDGKVVAIQKPALKEYFRKQYQRGLRHGLLSTCWYYHDYDIPHPYCGNKIQRFFGSKSDSMACNILLIVSRLACCFCNPIDYHFPTAG